MGAFICMNTLSDGRQFFLTARKSWSSDRTLAIEFLSVRDVWHFVVGTWRDKGDKLSVIAA